MRVGRPAALVLFGLLALSSAAGADTATVKLERRKVAEAACERASPKSKSVLGVDRKSGTFMKACVDAMVSALAKVPSVVCEYERSSDGTHVESASCDVKD